jgi:hypothetical protein
MVKSSDYGEKFLAVSNALERRTGGSYGVNVNELVRRPSAVLIRIAIVQIQLLL